MCRFVKEEYKMKKLNYKCFNVNLFSSVYTCVLEMPNSATTVTDGVFQKHHERIRIPYLKNLSEKNQMKMVNGKNSSKIP